MSTWCEAEYDDTCFDIAEPSDWFTPVLLVAVCRPSFFGHRLSPANQTWTRATRLDLGAQADHGVTCRTSALDHERRRYEMRG